jgi:hypothetical protein
LAVLGSMFGPFLVPLWSFSGPLIAPDAKFLAPIWLQ